MPAERFLIKSTKPMPIVAGRRRKTEIFGFVAHTGRRTTSLWFGDGARVVIYRGGPSLKSIRGWLHDEGFILEPCPEPSAYLTEERGEIEPKGDDA